MRLSILGLTLICLSLTLVVGLPVASADQDTEILVPLAEVIPEADGFIAEGEWDDAAGVTVGDSEFGGYLLVKHNWTYLYVYIDCPTDTINNPLQWDNGWVAIDPDLSRGSEPQEYDMLFHSHGHLAYIGDGVEPIEDTQWGVLRGHMPEDTPSKYHEMRDIVIEYYQGSGPGWGPTQASEALHRYWEFRIPLSLLELVPDSDTTTTFGFCASMEDYDQNRIADWPVTKSTGDFWPGPDDPAGSYSPPDSWGKLTLGPNTLPEPFDWPPLTTPTEIPYIYIIVIVVIVIVVILAVVIIKKKR